VKKHAESTTPPAADATTAAASGSSDSDDEAEDAIIRINPTVAKRVEEQVAQMIARVKSIHSKYWSCFQ
jgi:hypothetical protein